MYKTAIVGLGIAGLLVLAHMNPKDTLVLERGYVGGALATDYAHIVANIPAKILIQALRRIPGCLDKPLPYLDSYSPDDCPVLSDLVKQIKALVKPALDAATHHCTDVQQIQQIEGGWRIQTESGVFETQKVVLCTGAKPITMDLPIAHIPLPTALSLTLKHMVDKDSKVVVFGLSHSGTLVLKALQSLGVNQVTAVYKGPTPFRFARDGDTEGIKQESAAIADAILAKTWNPMPALVQVEDVGGLHRALQTADAVIYSMGFRSYLPFPILDLGGSPVSVETVKARTIPGLFGFGIGFPSMYTAPNGNQYPDVGVAGFLDAITAALPLLTS
jgi:pyruvate/2-oxoglutarate dehydrogenase complex dihydrolipoamide dehydrogenase (E3) component